MSFGEILGLAIFIVLGYIGLYLIVERICSCFEHCSLYKAYTEWRKSAKSYSSDGLDSAIKDFMSAMATDGANSWEDNK